MNPTTTSLPPPATAVAPTTLAGVLKPLLAVLTAEPSGDNLVYLEEISNIPSLPEVDPAVAAIYSITGDKKAPLLRRLEQLIRITAIPNGLSKEIPEDRTPPPLIVPIRFTLIRQTTGLFGELLPVHYLLGEIETEAGDLAGAVRQVALLVERLSQ